MHTAPNGCSALLFYLTSSKLLVVRGACVLFCCCGVQPSFVPSCVCLVGLRGACTCVCSGLEFFFLKRFSVQVGRGTRQGKQGEHGKIGW